MSKISKFKLYVLDLFYNVYIDCLTNNNLQNISEKIVQKLYESEYSSNLMQVEYLDILCDIINLYNIKYPEIDTKIINKLVK